MFEPLKEASTCTGRAAREGGKKINKVSMCRLFFLFLVERVGAVLLKEILTGLILTPCNFTVVKPFDAMDKIEIYLSLKLIYQS